MRWQVVLKSSASGRQVLSHLMDLRRAQIAEPFVNYLTTICRPLDKA